MVCCCQLLLTVLQQALKRLNALVTCNQLALSNGNFFLQRTVLLDELPLYNGELLEVALQEHHLLLLCAVVRGAEHVVVLLSRLVE